MDPRAKGLGVRQLIFKAANTFSAAFWSFATPFSDLRPTNVLLHASFQL